MERAKRGRGIVMKSAGIQSQAEAKRYVAWLDGSGTTPATRCFVEDISRAGAKLKVFGSPVPREFTLHFSRKGDAKVRCRVTSQAGSNCDVEFVASLAIYA